MLVMFGKPISKRHILLAFLDTAVRSWWLVGHEGARKRMDVVVELTWICSFLFRLSAPADKSQDGFSGEQFLVPRGLFWETADIEVLTVQVVFQYPVDFSHIHGIAQEHSFPMVGQRV